ncbi:MAG TPA: hypothetical protein VMW16_17140 [Sedimentisphaerales bacterium]|nr:hypothetical protein [Sedimentisphaerales bacterium]
MDKKAAKKKSIKGKKVPAKQGKSDAGYKKPPEETQFKPGESGNLAGPPVRRTQLWVWFCKFMALTDAVLARLDRKKLTQAQQVALRLVENAKDGKYSGSERLARHVFDREEGKAVEHLVIENENTLSDEECEQIKNLLKQSC